MTEAILAIVTAILLVVNGILFNSKLRADEKLRKMERDVNEEKTKLLAEERERARKRMRDLLEHYRGPKGQA